MDARRISTRAVRSAKVPARLARTHTHARASLRRGIPPFISSVPPTIRERRVQDDAKDEGRRRRRTHTARAIRSSMAGLQRPLVPVHGLYGAAPTCDRAVFRWRDSQYTPSDTILSERKKNNNPFSLCFFRKSIGKMDYLAELFEIINY